MNFSACNSRSDNTASRFAAGVAAISLMLPAGASVASLQPFNQLTSFARTHTHKGWASIQSGGRPVCHSKRKLSLVIMCRLITPWTICLSSGFRQMFIVFITSFNLSDRDIDFNSRTSGNPRLTRAVPRVVSQSTTRITCDT